MKKLLLIPAFVCFFVGFMSAQWVSTLGPYGGYLWQMKANDTYVYVSKTNGLYRSADGGLNWKSCDSTGLFGRMAIDGKHLLASYAYNGQGLLRYSSDNGDHWITVPLPSGIPAIDNFGVKGNILLFSWLGLLWRTEDFGQHWDSYEIPGEPFQHPNLLETYEGHFYLGNRSRLLSSEDSFEWTFLSEVPGISGNSIKKIFRKGEVLISICGKTVGRSLNGGLQWESGNTANNENLGANCEITCENGVFYMSTGKPMFQSGDNGLNWEYINADGPKIYFHTSQNNIILGHLFGLGAFRSTDGGQTFEPSNHGLGGGDVLTVGIQNNDLWVWDERGIVRQNTSQFDWDAAPDYPLPTYLGAFVSSYSFKNALYVRPDHGDLLRTFDQGQTWDTVTPAGVILSSDFVEFNQQNDTLYLSSEHFQTFRSTDYGDHWELLNPWVDAQIGSSMQDLTIQGSRIFVTDNHHVYQSADLSQSWQLVGDSLPFGPEAEWIRLFSTPHYLFAYVDQERIFRSDNQGESWEEIFIPLASDFLNWAENEVVFAEIEDVLIAFFERGGIFTSFDGGNSWNSFLAGIPFPEACTSFAYNDVNMWVGTYDYGLFQRPTQELAPLSTTQPVTLGQALKLFPNPSHGHFSCILPEGVSGEITLMVYDIQGRQILRQIASAEHLPDLYLPTPGTYCITLISSQGVFNGKIVIQ